MKQLDRLVDKSETSGKTVRLYTRWTMLFCDFTDVERDKGWNCTCVLTYFHWEWILLLVTASEGPLPAIMIATEPGDLLERSLDVLERSQAILERNLAMESTLARLAEGQEELRRMIMDFINGTDIPVATPTRSDRIGPPEMTPASTSIQNPAVKNEEEEETEMVELPSATPASPAEGDDDISSVSSVSTDEDVDYMDLSSANDLGGEEKNPPGHPTRGDLSVPHSVTENLSSGQESEEEDDGASSMGSEHNASTSGEETDLDDEDTARKSSPNTSAPNKYNSEALAVWKVRFDPI
uniref:CaM_binding domain-containing protein n=1 Tax=Steinernema glaseri TaxID=37863 RepID=A0A1I7Y010_9BILA